MQFMAKSKSLNSIIQRLTDDDNNLIKKYNIYKWEIVTMTFMSIGEKWISCL